jgi:hypothetical protein
MNDLISIICPIPISNATKRNYLANTRKAKKLFLKTLELGASKDAIIVATYHGCRDFFVLAVDYGNYEVSKYFIYQLKMPLCDDVFYSAARNSKKILKLLIKKAGGKIPEGTVSAAAAVGNFSIIKLLERNGVDLGEMRGDPLLGAIQTEKIRIIKYLLKKTNVSSEMLLMASWCSVTIIKTLLDDSRIDPSYNENEALIEAIIADNTDMVECLLKHPKMNPALRLQEYIGEATSNGRYEIIKILLNDKRILGLLSKVELLSLKSFLIDKN